MTRETAVKLATMVWNDGYASFVKPNRDGTYRVRVNTIAGGVTFRSFGEYRAHWLYDVSA